jgi:type VI secretion-associated protein, BMA_A0400 family
MAQHFVGYFGKLPASGDFVVRGLPKELSDHLYVWFSNGMLALERYDPAEWQHAYLVTPVWHFIFNRGVWGSQALQGCIAPSIDKVGRYSPLAIVRSFESTYIREVLPPVDSWLYQVDASLRRSISEQVPAEEILSSVDILFSQRQIQTNAQSAATILNELGIVDEVMPDTRKRWFSWPDLPQSFLDRSHRCFWWAEPSPKQPPRQVIHSGKPDEDLFRLLFGGGLF